jgi:hypothetical protein
MLSNNHLDGTIPAEIGQILPSISMTDLPANELAENLTQPFAVQQIAEPSGCK